MRGGPDRKNKREGKRPHSPPQPDWLPFTREKLEELVAAMDQYYQEALAEVEPLLAAEVAGRKRAWEAKWTGNLGGAVVSSAKITELEAKMSEGRINIHEKKYLRLLRDMRQSDYALARLDIVQATVKDFKRAAIQEILQTRHWSVTSHFTSKSMNCALTHGPIPPSASSARARRRPVPPSPPLPMPHSACPPVA